MTVDNKDRGASLPPPQEVENAYPPVGSPAPAADPGGVAAQAISDVLGWKWRAGDTQGFQAALTGSFELQKIQGHTEATWTPRGYAVQADLGAVTGGQASLAARARSAVKDSLALLKSLRSLLTTADPENAEGYRALVQHELEEILKELESPMIRVPRVDQLFVLLLGEDPAPNAISGHLGNLRDQFGLVGGNVNTIEEERIQTSFVTLSDWVLSLQRGWIDARSSIDPFAVHNETPYFGPAVLALSQLLSAAAAQVVEIKSALRSVGVQDEEIDVLRVPLPASPPSVGSRPPTSDCASMSLGGLLSWVSSFATDEGRTLIESAGKEGVSTAFLQVAMRLESYVSHLPRPGGEPRERAGLPTGFFSFRVQRAIDELQDYLEEVVRIAMSIRPTAPPATQPMPGPVPPAPGPSVPAPVPPAPAEPAPADGQGATTPEKAPPTTPPQKRSRAAARERPGGTGPSTAK